LISDIVKNLKKDLLIEFRSRYAFNISIAFAGISTLSISLVSGGVPFSPRIQSIMLWLIMFFCAMNGLSHIFIREVDERTALFLRLSSEVNTVFISKLVFNFVFFIIMQSVVSLLFLFFLQVQILNGMLFVLTVFSGGIATVAATTVMGAIVARSGGRGALFTVISFPVLLPVLWIAMSTTEKSLSSAAKSSYGNIVFLLAFSGIIISLSILLFQYIWLEE